MKKRNIIYLVTEDWYFWSHRVILARAAKAEGFGVIVATMFNKHRERIEKEEGFIAEPISLRRKSKNVLRELKSIADIMRIYRKHKPDIVHHVAFKPILYGSLAARLTGVKCVVNALGGLGLIFVRKGFKAMMARRTASLAYRLAFTGQNNYCILQNPDDLRQLVSSGVLREDRAVLVRGAGVDPSKYRYFPEPEGEIKILFISRMLWNKGAGEVVGAAKRLNEEGIKCKVILAGVPDHENPQAIPEKKLEEWNSLEYVDWLGHVDNVPEIISKSHIVCLPSTYGEGVPKALIEAASCGRPIVATDIPGCREIVRHGKNGLLVPPDDIERRTAAALKKLIANPAMRRELGLSGIDIVKSEFTDKIVVEKTMNLYRRLMNEAERTAKG